MRSKSLGRPREAAVHAAILQAAYDLLEEKGHRGLTMEGVARRASVSKASIYRRWPTVGDLLLDALVSRNAASLPIPSSGNLYNDLKSFLTASFRRLATPTGRLMRSLAAHAQIDDDFRTRFRTTFVEARRAGVRSILELAVSRGEIPSNINRDLLIDFFYGVLWYRLLIGHAPLDDKGASDVADYICRIVAAPKRTRSAKGE